MAQLAPKGPSTKQERSRATRSPWPRHRHARVVAADHTLYERLRRWDAADCGFESGFERHGFPSFVNCAGAMFSIFLTRDEVRDLRGAQTTDRASLQNTLAPCSSGASTSHRAL